MLAERDHAFINCICKISTKDFADVYLIFVNPFFLSIDLLSFLRKYANSTSTWGRALCETELQKAWTLSPDHRWSCSGVALSYYLKLLK
jgi:hypothetical protein